MQQPKWEDLVIIVRDRREPCQFSTHNNLIDQWHPIIKDIGFTLYSFYIRLSNKKDERAFPGFKLICRHFGYSRPTIQLYNQLLTWSKLIHIQPGDQHSPNQYFILEVPSVDTEALDHIRHHALTDLDPTKPHEFKFQHMLLHRLDHWKPIQHWWWARGRRGIVTVTRAQLELNLTGLNAAGDGEKVVYQENQGGLAGKPPQFTRKTTPVYQENQGSLAGKPEQSEDNNPKGTHEKQQHDPVAVLQSVLEFRGIEPAKAAQLIAKFGHDSVNRQQEWLSFRLDEIWTKGKEVGNVAGLLIASIEGDWSAPATWQEWGNGEKT